MHLKIIFVYLIIELFYFMRHMMHLTKVFFKFSRLLPKFSLKWELVFFTVYFLWLDHLTLCVCPIWNKKGEENRLLQTYRQTPEWSCNGSVDTFWGILMNSQCIVSMYQSMYSFDLETISNVTNVMLLNWLTIQPRECK